jgi:hypothetical protein
MTFAFSKELTSTDLGSAQPPKQNATKRHFVGSSLFLLGNIDSGKPVYFGQLNYGYRIASRGNVLVEATTWTYYEPLGTYGDSEKLYPGKVRAIGVGLGYQQFFHKNMFTSVIATPFLQQFYDKDDKEIQQGFQLYLQLILGNRLEFCKKRLFAEPGVALKYWPVNTNFPHSFAVIEKGKPKYKLEPTLNFGYKF